LRNLLRLALSTVVVGGVLAFSDWQLEYGSRAYFGAAAGLVLALFALSRIPR
jgi:hypothetical protein